MCIGFQMIFRAIRNKGSIVCKKEHFSLPNFESLYLLQLDNNSMHIIDK